MAGPTSCAGARTALRPAVGGLIRRGDWVFRGTHRPQRWVEGSSDSADGTAGAISRLRWRGE